MKWKEISLRTTLEAQELIADILERLTGEGVSVDDPSDVRFVVEHEKFWDYIDEKLLKDDSSVFVRGYVEEEKLDKVLSELNGELDKIKSEGFIDVGNLSVTIGEADDEDWFNNWKKYYDVIHIGKIVIVPEWIDYAAKEGEAIVRIRPGAGFGTGEHESTRMCLKFLDGLDVKGRDVVDVGCGSGILSVAAVKCGAKSAYMTDLDENAVKSSRENIELNGVSGECVAECRDLAEGVTGDVVFANITADILIRLSERITKLVRPGGYVILSGIIRSRLHEVIQAYEAAGLTVERIAEDGEWNAVLTRWI